MKPPMVATATIAAMKAMLTRAASPVPTVAAVTTCPRFLARLLDRFRAPSMIALSSSSEWSDLWGDPDNVVPRAPNLQSWSPVASNGDRAFGTLETLGALLASGADLGPPGGRGRVQFPRRPPGAGDPVRGGPRGAHLAPAG